MHRPHHPRSTPATPRAAGPTTPPRTAAPADGKSHPTSADDIRLRAYRKWEAAGQPPGDGVRFWLEAERELTRGA